MFVKGEKGEREVLPWSTVVGGSALPISALACSLGFNRAPTLPVGTGDPQ